MMNKKLCFNIENQYLYLEQVLVDYMDIPIFFLCKDKKHSNSWDRVSKSLKEYPDMRVKIVSGKDTLCTTCPNDGSKGTTCNGKRLKILDDQVKNLINIKDNVIYRFNDLMAKVREVMTPEKHKELCGSCQWRSKGLCNDTFQKQSGVEPYEPQEVDPEDIFMYAV